MAERAREIPNQEIVPPLDERYIKPRPYRNGTNSRVPPHDLDAEASLVGACLLPRVNGDTASPSSAVDVALSQGVTVTDFYKPAHGHIYGAVIDLVRKGVAPDPVTVADELHRDGLLETIGGAAALLELQTGTPAVSGAPRYAQIVVDMARLRDLIRGAAEVADLAYSLPDDLEAAEARALAHITNIRPRPVAAVDPYVELDDFLADADPDNDHNWIVPGLLEAGDRCIITAIAGHGKSTMLRQIGVKAAAGLHPYNDTTIDPVRTLLLDVENSKLQVQREIWPLRQAAGHRYEKGWFKVRVYGAAIPLADPAVELDICRQIEAFEPGIVMLGPLYKLIVGKPIDEEPARQVADTIDRIRGICGSCVLIEAHSPYSAKTGTGKNPKRETRPYGASLWERWPEFGWWFNDAGEVEHWRGQREQRDWPTSLERSAPWPWRTRRTLEERADGGDWHGPTRCIDAIVQLLEDTGEELTGGQLYTRLKAANVGSRGFREETVRSAAEQAALDPARPVAVRNGPNRSRIFSHNPLNLLADDIEQGTF